MKNLRYESGAALVEAVLVMPLLILFLFGIVEFANAYALQNDVRGATETLARAAADTDGTLFSDDLKLLICGSLDVEDFGDVSVDVSLSPTDPGTADPVGSRGAIGRVTIVAEYTSFTGFFDGFADANNIRLVQAVDFVVENPVDVTPGWWPMSGGFDC